MSPRPIHNYSSYQLCDGASNTHLYTFINDYACISINTTHNGTFYSGPQTCIAYLNGIQIYSADGDNTFYISNIKNGDVLEIYWQSSSRWTPILTISAFL